MGDSPAPRAACASAMYLRRHSSAVRWGFSAVGTRSGLMPLEAAARRRAWLVDQKELAARRRDWKQRPPRHRAGALAKYARLVGHAPGGAVTHEGPAEWPWFE